jgi:hypothetical protein
MYLYCVHSSIGRVKMKPAPVLIKHLLDVYKKLDLGPRAACA